LNCMVNPPLIGW